MNNALSITYTSILPIEDGIGGCVAIAQIVLNDAVKLTGIKLIERDEKRFVSYPRNLSNKHKKAYCYPINKETADFIANRLWNDYDNAVVSEND